MHTACHECHSLSAIIAATSQTNLWEALASLFGNSPYLTRLALRFPDSLPQMFHRAPEDVRDGLLQEVRDAIGASEDTALIVQGDRGEVIGRSFALVYDNQSTTGPDGKFYFLSAGARLNLATREATRPSTIQAPIGGVQKKPWGGGGS